MNVYEEYLIYDVKGMVGSIGGTLGLFIGFSFYNVIGYLQEALALIIKFQRYKKEIFCQNKIFWKMPNSWYFLIEIAKLSNAVLITESKTVLIASESWLPNGLFERY